MATLDSISGDFEGLCTIRQGRNLYLHVSGENSTTLFFIHGACARFAQFSAQIEEALAQNYRVVLCDALGCGGSEKPFDWDAYSTQEFLEDWKLIISKLASKQNFLIGHSFGSSQVIRLAVEAESSEFNIAGVVLISSSIFVSASHPIFYLPPFILDWLRPAMHESFQSRAFHSFASQELKDSERQASLNNLMFTVRAFYRQFEWAPRETIEQVKCPALLISGESDEITPVSQARELVDALPNVKDFIVVENASHQVMQERPDIVNNHIFSFLKSI